VSGVVEGGDPPELLGKQMVTWDPTTVNLPPFDATDPSGRSVSLVVKGTLCDNAASASIGAPAPAPALGGNVRYVFWGGLGREYRLIPVLDLVVEITITEEIVVSPKSGVTTTTPHALPIGFQINGFPLTEDKQRAQRTRDLEANCGRPSHCLAAIRRQDVAEYDQADLVRLILAYDSRSEPERHQHVQPVECADGWVAIAGEINRVFEVALIPR
jgi:hypothetical protein